MTRQGTVGSSEGLTRRQLLGWGVVAAGAAAGSALLVNALIPEGANRQPQETFRPVEGGEILDNKELVARLNERAAQRAPVTPDPSVLTSTLYAVLRHQGIPVESAQITANRLVVGDLHGPEGRAELDSGGLYVQLDEASFDSSGGRQTHASWPSLIHLIGHEGTHVSSILDTTGTIEEDYGPLGKARRSGGIFGFAAAQEQFTGPFNFIRPTVTGGKLPNVIEEWAAEAGRISFIRDLGRQGLSDAYTQSVTTSRLSCRCHAFLEPSIKQAHGAPLSRTIGPVLPSGQSGPFGSVFTPDWILNRHRERQLAGAYWRLGKGVLEQNTARDQQPLAEASIRGLGMLGFSAFVHEQGEQTPGTLQALRHTPIDNARLLDLAERHQQFLHATYKK